MPWCRLTAVVRRVRDEGDEIGRDRSRIGRLPADIQTMTSVAISARAHAGDRLLAEVRRNPPNAHPSAPAGVWSATLDCLEFIYEHADGKVTLETGCGASTIVFAAVASEHTAVFLSPSEGDAVAQWCIDHDVDTTKLTLAPGSSPEVLTKMAHDPIDVLFIDGCHAHPFPQLDWYLAAPRVRVGGIVIVDDIQLPGPASLHRFLRRDDRWELLADAGYWSAFRRRAPFDVATEWASQAHPVDSLDRVRHVARAPRRLAALLRNARNAQRLGVAPWQRR
jgi:predicted O-methyltransferase YrrM